jgi:hypothetical protein
METQPLSASVSDSIFRAPRNLHDVILIISDLAQPISTFFNVSSLISDLSLHWYYLCIPHTIVYLSDVFPTLSNLFQSLFIFALIDVLMFWLFLIVDRFHWLWCYYTFGLWSLWTISHIWTLWHHFDPSDVTITYTSPTTPIQTREKLCTLHPQTL